MTFATVTITGNILRDGVPAVGRAVLVPSVNTISDTNGNVVLYGPLHGNIDDTGSFSIDAPATDDPNLTPSFGYTLKFEVQNGAIPAVTNFGLPTSLVTIDLTDLYAAQGYYGSGDYTPVLQGYSTYDLAVQDGYTGTEAEWIAHVKAQNALFQTGAFVSLDTDGVPYVGAIESDAGVAVPLAVDTDGVYYLVIS